MTRQTLTPYTKVTRARAGGEGREKEARQRCRTRSKGGGKTLGRGRSWGPNLTANIPLDNTRRVHRDPEMGTKLLSATHPSPPAHLVHRALAL